MLDDIRNDQNFLARAITGDKSWVHYYYPETELHSSQWKNLTSYPTKTGQVRSNIKSMFVVFDCKGIHWPDGLPALLLGHLECLKINSGDNRMMAEPGPIDSP